MSADMAAAQSRSPVPVGQGQASESSPSTSFPPATIAPLEPTRSLSPSRAPTSAEIDAVIAAAMANAPPAMLQPVYDADVSRSKTPLMTNLLPSAVGADGRVNLFVGNLPYRVRWQDLKDLFRKAGTVLRADVSLGQDNRSRGYGTVLMGSREDAARAIDRYNGFTWQTRTLEVRPDRLPPEYEAQQHYPNHVNPHPGAPGHGYGHALGPGQAQGNMPMQHHLHPLGMPSGPGGPLPPFIAGSQTHPYPHPQPLGQQGWHGPGGAGQGQGPVPGHKRGGGASTSANDAPQLHHPFPQQAIHPGQGVPGSQAGLLHPLNGAGGVRGLYGSFGAMGAQAQGPGGAGAAGLTPHLTGTSSVPGGPLAAERNKDDASPFPVAASPLAGALTGTAGGIQAALPVPGLQSGNSLEARSSEPAQTRSTHTSPLFTHAVPPAGASTSSASTSAHNTPLYAVQSRTSGTSGTSESTSITPPVPSSQTHPHPHSHSHSASTSSRAAPPGGLGPLPLNYFAALAGGTNGNTGSSGSGAGAGAGAASSNGARGQPAAPHFPVPIEGMANQGVGLGPPENLHDRVVFVSNMPLNMEWQDLKDMLRPAGMIMRVDVAQDDNRRPRGYGTALFASEQDAARAVQMFNGTEIGGHRLRVHLERDASVSGASQPESSASSSVADESEGEKKARSFSANAKGKGSATSPARSRVPWGINTTVAQTPIRKNKISSSPNGTPYAHLPNSPTLFPGGPTPGPSFRSNAPPGPISMPPFGLDPNSYTPAHLSHGPLSPQMRGLPPMTPSMPGFVFNGYPDTPGPHFFGHGGHAQQQGYGGFGGMGMGMHMGMSMMPMGMMTPGPVIAPAPFSPGLPMSPMHPHTPNPFLNTAPGAPIDRVLAQNQAQTQAQSVQANGGQRSVPGPTNGNGVSTPARPGAGEGLRGSAALGTPTTTVFAGRAAAAGRDDDVSAETPGPIRGGAAAAHSNGTGYFPYVPRADAGDATPSRSRKVSEKGPGRLGSRAIDESPEIEEEEGESHDGAAGLATLAGKLDIGDEGADQDGRDAGDEVQGRHSLDGARPRAISTSLSERRASFGDRR